MLLFSNKPDEADIDDMLERVCGRVFRRTTVDQEVLNINLDTVEIEEEAIIQESM